jgi:hypothetical protein
VGSAHRPSCRAVGSAEIIDDNSLQLLHDVKNDTVTNFITAHPDWVTAS